MRIFPKEHGGFHEQVLVVELSALCAKVIINFSGLRKHTQANFVAALSPCAKKWFNYFFPEPFPLSPFGFGIIARKGTGLFPLFLDDSDSLIEEFQNLH